MPTKTVTYKQVKFTQEVIIKAFEEFTNITKDSSNSFIARDVDFDNGISWRHDNNDEFFADYNKNISVGSLHWSNNNKSFCIWFYGESNPRSMIHIKLDKRDQVERVFNIFDQAKTTSMLPIVEQKTDIKDKVNIFIGHGQSDLWRELNDHLRDKHQFKTVAFETGARAGLSIQEILLDMINSSSFALLVFTADNQDASGEYYARLNVVHETGLFQGNLGFRRAIVLIEEGCRDFSNIHGIYQIRFSKGNIKETFGEVIATIYREFENESEEDECDEEE